MTALQALNLLRRLERVRAWIPANTTDLRVVVSDVCNALDGHVQHEMRLARKRRRGKR